MNLHSVSVLGHKLLEGGIFVLWAAVEHTVFTATVELSKESQASAGSLRFHMNKEKTSGHTYNIPMI